MSEWVVSRLAATGEDILFVADGKQGRGLG